MSEWELVPYAPEDAQTPVSEPRTPVSPSVSSESEFLTPYVPEAAPVPVSNAVETLPEGVPSFSWIGRPLKTPIESTAFGQRYLEIKNKNLQGSAGFGESITPGLEDIPFAGDILDVKDLIDIPILAQKMKNNEDLTDDELVKLNYFVEDSERDRNASTLGMVGAGIKGLVKYGTEFGAYSVLIGSGLGAIEGVSLLGKKFATQAAKTAAEKAGKEFVEAAAKSGLRGWAAKSAFQFKAANELLSESLEKTVAKVWGRKASQSLLAAKGVGMLGSNLAMGVPLLAVDQSIKKLASVAAGQEELYTKPELLGEMQRVAEGNSLNRDLAGWARMGDQYWELQSELMGGLLGKVGGKALKATGIKPGEIMEMFGRNLAGHIQSQYGAIGTKAAADAVKKATWTAASASYLVNLSKRLHFDGTTIAHMAEVGGYNGLLEEMAEERFGGFMKGLTGTSGTGDWGLREAWDQMLPPIKDLGVELMVFATPAIAANGVHAGLLAMNGQGIGQFAKDIRAIQNMETIQRRQRMEGEEAPAKPPTYQEVLAELKLDNELAPKEKQMSEKDLEVAAKRRHYDIEKNYEGIKPRASAETDEQRNAAETKYRAALERQSDIRRKSSKSWGMASQVLKTVSGLLHFDAASAMYRDVDTALNSNGVDHAPVKAHSMLVDKLLQDPKFEPISDKVTGEERVAAETAREAKAKSQATEVVLITARQMRASAAFSTPELAAEAEKTKAVKLAPIGQGRYRVFRNPNVPMSEALHKDFLKHGVNTYAPTPEQFQQERDLDPQTNEMFNKWANGELNLAESARVDSNAGFNIETPEGIQRAKETRDYVRSLKDTLFEGKSFSDTKNSRFKFNFLSSHPYIRVNQAQYDALDPELRASLPSFSEGLAMTAQGKAVGHPIYEGIKEDEVLIGLGGMVEKDGKVSLFVNYGDSLLGHHLTHEIFHRILTPEHFDNETDIGKYLNALRASLVENQKRLGKEIKERVTPLADDEQKEETSKLAGWAKAVKMLTPPSAPSAKDGEAGIARWKAALVQRSELFTALMLHRHLGWVSSEEQTTATEQALHLFDVTAVLGDPAKLPVRGWEGAQRQFTDALSEATGKPMKDLELFRSPHKSMAKKELAVTPEVKAKNEEQEAKAKAVKPPLSALLEAAFTGTEAKAYASALARTMKAYPRIREALANADVQDEATMRQAVALASKLPADFISTAASPDFLKSIKEGTQYTDFLKNLHEVAKMTKLTPEQREQALLHVAKNPEAPKKAEGETVESLSDHGVKLVATVEQAQIIEGVGKFVTTGKHGGAFAVIGHPDTGRLTAVMEGLRRKGIKQDEVLFLGNTKAPPLSAAQKLSSITAEGVVVLAPWETFEGLAKTHYDNRTGEVLSFGDRFPGVKAIIVVNGSDFQESQFKEALGNKGLPIFVLAEENGTWYRKRNGDVEQGFVLSEEGRQKNKVTAHRTSSVFAPLGETEMGNARQLWSNHAKEKAKGPAPEMLPGNSAVRTTDRTGLMTQFMDTVPVTGPVDSVLVTNDPDQRLEANVAVRQKQGNLDPLPQEGERILTKNGECRVLKRGPAEALLCTADPNAPTIQAVSDQAIRVEGSTVTVMSVPLTLQSLDNASEPFVLGMIVPTRDNNTAWSAFVRRLHSQAIAAQKAKAEAAANLQLAPEDKDLQNAYRQAVVNNGAAWNAYISVTDHFGSRIPINLTTAADVASIDEGEEVSSNVDELEFLSDAQESALQALATLDQTQDLDSKKAAYRTAEKALNDLSMAWRSANSVRSSAPAAFQFAYARPINDMLYSRNHSIVFVDPVSDYEGEAASPSTTAKSIARAIYGAPHAMVLLPSATVEHDPFTQVDEVKPPSPPTNLPKVARTDYEPRAHRFRFDTVVTWVPPAKGSTKAKTPKAKTPAAERLPEPDVDLIESTPSAMTEQLSAADRAEYEKLFNNAELNDEDGELPQPNPDGSHNSAQGSSHYPPATARERIIESAVRLEHPNLGGDDRKKMIRTYLETVAGIPDSEIPETYMDEDSADLPDGEPEDSVNEEKSEIAPNASERRAEKELSKQFILKLANAMHPGVGPQRVQAYFEAQREEYYRRMAAIYDEAEKLRKTLSGDAYDAAITKLDADVLADSTRRPMPMLWDEATFEDWKEHGDESFRNNAIPFVRDSERYVRNLASGMTYAEFTDAYHGLVSTQSYVTHTIQHLRNKNGKTFSYWRAEGSMESLTSKLTAHLASALGEQRLVSQYRASDVRDLAGKLHDKWLTIRPASKGMTKATRPADFDAWFSTLHTSAKAKTRQDLVNFLSQLTGVPASYFERGILLARGDKDHPQSMQYMLSELDFHLGSWATREGHAAYAFAKISPSAWLAALSDNVFGLQKSSNRFKPEMDPAPVKLAMNAPLTAHRTYSQWHATALPNNTKVVNYRFVGPNVAALKLAQYSQTPETEWVRQSDFVLDQVLGINNMNIKPVRFSTPKDAGFDGRARTDAFAGYYAQGDGRIFLELPAGERRAAVGINMIRPSQMDTQTLRAAGLSEKLLSRIAGMKRDNSRADFIIDYLAARHLVDTLVRGDLKTVWRNNALDAGKRESTFGTQGTPMLIVKNGLTIFTRVGFIDDSKDGKDMLDGCTVIMQDFATQFDVSTGTLDHRVIDLAKAWGTMSDSDKALATKELAGRYGEATTPAEIMDFMARNYQAYKLAIVGSRPDLIKSNSSKLTEAFLKASGLGSPQEGLMAAEWAKWNDFNKGTERKVKMLITLSSVKVPGVKEQVRKESVETKTPTQWLRTMDIYNQAALTNEARVQDTAIPYQTTTDTSGAPGLAAIEAHMMTAAVQNLLNSWDRMEGNPMKRVAATEGDSAIMRLYGREGVSPMSPWRLTQSQIRAEKAFQDAGRGTMKGVHALAIPSGGAGTVSDSAKVEKDGRQRTICARIVAHLTGPGVFYRTMFDSHEAGVMSVVEALRRGERYDMLEWDPLGNPDTTPESIVAQTPDDASLAAKVRSYEITQQWDPETKTVRWEVPGSFVLVNRTPGTSLASHIPSRLTYDPGIEFGNSLMMDEKTIKRAGVDYDGDTWSVFINSPHGYVATKAGDQLAVAQNNYLAGIFAVLDNAALEMLQATTDPEYFSKGENQPEMQALIERSKAETENRIQKNGELTDDFKQWLTDNAFAGREALGAAVAQVGVLYRLLFNSGFSLANNRVVYSEGGKSIERNDPFSVSFAAPLPLEFKTKNKLGQEVTLSYDFKEKRFLFKEKPDVVFSVDQAKQYYAKMHKATLSYQYNPIPIDRSASPELYDRRAMQYQRLFNIMINMLVDDPKHGVAKGLKWTPESVTLMEFLILGAPVSDVLNLKDPSGKGDQAKADQLFYNVSALMFDPAMAQFLRLTEFSKRPSTVREFVSPEDILQVLSGVTPKKGTSKLVTQWKIENADEKPADPSRLVSPLLMLLANTGTAVRSLKNAVKYAQSMSNGLPGWMRANVAANRLMGNDWYRGMQEGLDRQGDRNTPENLVALQDLIAKVGMTVYPPSHPDRVSDGQAYVEYFASIIPHLNPAIFEDRSLSLAAKTAMIDQAVQARDKLIAEDKYAEKKKGSVDQQNAILNRVRNVYAVNAIARLPGVSAWVRQVPAGEWAAILARALPSLGKFGEMLQPRQWNDRTASEEGDVVIDEETGEEVYYQTRESNWSATGSQSSLSLSPYKGLRLEERWDTKAIEDAWALFNALPETVTVTDLGNKEHTLTRRDMQVMFLANAVLQYGTSTGGVAKKGNYTLIIPASLIKESAEAYARMIAGKKSGLSSGTQVYLLGAHSAYKPRAVGVLREVLNGPMAQSGAEEVGTYTRGDQGTGGTQGSAVAGQTYGQTETAVAREVQGTPGVLTRRSLINRLPKETQAYIKKFDAAVNRMGGISLTQDELDMLDNAPLDSSSKLSEVFDSFREATSYELTHSAGAEDPVSALEREVKKEESPKPSIQVSEKLDTTSPQASSIKLAVHEHPSIVFNGIQEHPDGKAHDLALFTLKDPDHNRRTTFAVPVAHLADLLPTEQLRIIEEHKKRILAKYESATATQSATPQASAISLGVSPKGEVSLQFSWHKAFTDTPERVRKQQTLVQQLQRVQVPKDEAAAFMAWAAGKTGDVVALLNQYEAEVLPKLEIAPVLETKADQKSLMTGERPALTAQGILRLDGFHLLGVHYEKHQERQPWGVEETWTANGEKITSQEAWNRARELSQQMRRQQTQNPAAYYESLSVNKGQGEYKEYFIKTPFPVPGQHGEFTDPNLAGWFRVREYGEDAAKLASSVREPGLWGDIEPQQFSNQEEYEAALGRNIGVPQGMDGVLEVQEIQSELFQKNKGGFTEGPSSYTGPMDSLDEDGNTAPVPSSKMTFSNGYPVKRGATFLNLMVKDQTWAPVFTQAIMQWAKNQGFSRVRFPTGETAARVEGHQVLADRLTALQGERSDHVAKLNETPPAGMVFGGRFGEFVRDPNGTYRTYPANTPATEAEALAAWRGVRQGLIDALDAEIQNLKTQGIKKLAPIEAFYEKRVAAIVNRMGAQPVTDANGNTWREVSLAPAATTPAEVSPQASARQVSNQAAYIAGDNYKVGLRKPGYPDEGNRAFINDLKQNKLPLHLRPIRRVLQMLDKPDSHYIEIRNALIGDKNGKGGLHADLSPQRILNLVLSHPELYTKNPGYTVPSNEVSKVPYTQTELKLDYQAEVESARGDVQFPMVDTPYKQGTLPFGANEQASFISPMGMGVPGGMTQNGTVAMHATFRDSMNHASAVLAREGNIRKRQNRYWGLEQGNKILGYSTEIRKRPDGTEESVPEWDDKKTMEFTDNDKENTEYFLNIITLIMGSKRLAGVSSKTNLRTTINQVMKEEKIPYGVQSFTTGDGKSVSGDETLETAWLRFENSDTAAKLRKMGRTVDRSVIYNEVQGYQELYEETYKEFSKHMGHVRAYVPLIFGDGIINNPAAREARNVVDRLLQLSKRDESNTRLSEAEYTKPSEEQKIQPPPTQLQKNVLIELDPTFKQAQDGTLHSSDGTPITVDDLLDGHTMMDANAMIRGLLYRAELDKAYKAQVLPNEGAYKPDEITLNTIAKLDKILRNNAHRAWSARAESRRLPNASTYWDAWKNYGLRPKSLNVIETRFQYVRDMYSAMTHRALLSQMAMMTDETGTPLTLIVPGDQGTGKHDAIPTSVLIEHATMVGRYYGIKVPILNAKNVREFLRNMVPQLPVTAYNSLPSPFTGIVEIKALKGDATAIMKKLVMEPRKWMMGDVDVMQKLMGLVMTTKMLSVGWSIFFPASLMESVIAGTGPKFGQKRQGSNNVLQELFMKQPETGLNFYRHLRDLHDQMLDPKSPMSAIITALQEEGVEIGGNSTSDEMLNIIERGYGPMIEKVRLAKGKETAERLEWWLGAGSGQKMSKFFFNDLFPVIKVWAAHRLMHEIAYKTGLDINDPIDRKTVMRRVAPIINDAYGGQSWHRYLWANPRSLQYMNLIFFASNWTLSAWNQAGGGLLTGRLFGNTMSKTNMDFVMKTNWPAMLGIVMLGIPSLLQAAIWAASKAVGGGDPEDKPFPWLNEAGKQWHIDITPLMRAFPGYTGDPTGKRREYMRFGKQAYEVIDGWLAEPLNQFLRKTSQPVRIVLEQVTGMSPGSDWNLEFKGQGMAGLLKSNKEGFEGLLTSRVGYVATKFLPMSIVQVVKNATQEDFSAMLELPLYATAPISKGKSLGMATKEFTQILEAYADDETYNFLLKNPATKERLRSLAPALLDAVERNGYDSNKVVNSAKGVVLGRLYKNFMESVSKNDAKEMDRVAKQILRVGGTIQGAFRSAKNRAESYNKPLTPEMGEAMKQAFGAGGMP